MLHRLNIELSDQTVFASRHLQPFRLFLSLANLGGLSVNRFDAKKVMKDVVLGATHGAADLHLPEQDGSACHLSLSVKLQDDVSGIKLLSLEPCLITPRPKSPADMKSCVAATVTKPPRNTSNPPRNQTSRHNKAPSNRG